MVKYINSDDSDAGDGENGDNDRQSDALGCLQVLPSFELTLLFLFKSLSKID